MCDGPDTGTKSASVVATPVAHAAIEAEPQHEEPAPAAPVVEEVEPVKVTALQLWKDYDGNEVSADAQYKDKPLLVTGKVGSIDKDFMGDVVLKLIATSRWEDVHAELEDGEASTAAGLSKGASVTLRCTGGGRIIGSPMLKDCRFN